MVDLDDKHLPSGKLKEITLGDELPRTTHAIYFHEPGDLYAQLWDGGTEWHIDVKAGTTIEVNAKVVLGGPDQLFALY